MKKTRTTGKAVGVGELKARLSEYLRLVKGGQEVVVTERGRAIARISPVAAVSDPAGRLALLIATGAARGPKRPLPRDFWDRPLPADPDGLALEYLLEERAEGR